mgnify:CR=1 FL=1
MSAIFFAVENNHKSCVKLLAEQPNIQVCIGGGLKCRPLVFIIQNILGEDDNEKFRKQIEMIKLFHECENLTLLSKTLTYGNTFGHKLTINCFTNQMVFGEYEIFDLLYHLLAHAPRMLLMVNHSKINLLHSAILSGSIKTVKLIVYFYKYLIEFHFDYLELYQEILGLKYSDDQEKVNKIKAQTKAK